MQTSNTTPTRHSTKAVERYRPFIESVSANHPRPIVIDPAPLSPDTFACRFRDAVSGIMRYNSSADLFPTVSLWAGDFTVACIPGTGQLVIGSKAVIKSALKVDNGVGRVIDASLALPQVVESPSERILSAILVLMDCHILEHATLTGVDETLITSLLPKYSRQIEMVGSNGTITLL